MKPDLGALPVAVVLALLSGPALAQEDNNYSAGVAARLAGDPARAKILLARWLADHPGDVDAQLQLAYANLALGELDSAESGFRAVLAAAPDYADARSGLEQVRARRGSDDEDDAMRISIDAALSELSGASADWRELALDAEGRVGGATLGGRVTRYRRFGLNDTEYDLRIDVRPADNLWLRAHTGGTVHADFRPKFEVGGGVDVRLSRTRSTVLTFDGAYQRFPLQDVITINPGVVRYLADERTWLTLRGIATVADGGPLQIGGLTRIDHALGDRWRLFAGAANGPDTDLGVITRTSGLFGGIEAPLGQRVSLTGAISREWRDMGSDRTEFRMTIAVRR